MIKRHSALTRCSCHCTCAHSVFSRNIYIFELTRRQPVLVFQLLDVHVIEHKRVGSELQVEAIEHHNACSTSPCKLLPVNPRPALAPSPLNRVGVGPRAAPQHAAPQPHNRLSTRVAPHHPHLSPQNHAAAAANVKFTERKARERAAAHCSTCMR